jgi:hypothetical protein
MCFGMDGTLVWAKHNFAGSWHDAVTSSDLQDRLCDRAINIDGGRIIADSAFPVSGRMHGRIITPLKTGDLQSVPEDLRESVVAVSNAITSIRQGAEWGVNSLRKVWRILLLPLPYVAETRRQRLLIIFHLHNLRVRTTSITQIGNVFRPYGEA